MNGRRAFFLSVWTLTFSLSTAPVAAAGWPNGLREAAQAHFTGLSAEDGRTRESTLAEPHGVIADNVFDRASHKCHEAIAQRYRVFGRLILAGHEHDGSFLVQAPFQVYYRQGNDLQDLFSQPWKRGTDSVLQVRFREKDGVWSAAEEQELIRTGDFSAPGGT